MEDNLMYFDMPIHNSSIIKVIGVGGGGSNAVNHMYQKGIKDVDFVVCNTDAQALANSPIPVKIQLGAAVTEGRGAGNKPEIGRQSAIESEPHLREVLGGTTKMVFITAGMGGGTGTGAAPEIARIAKDMGLLTVAIVTIPFRNEGQRRVNQAIEGIAEIESHVDSLLIINNEKIRQMYGDLKVSQAFSRADDVLSVAAKGIAEIITVHGYINVDFADVETVMTNSGVAIMGSATAEGEDRAMQAVEEALNSPLLNDNDIQGAKNILINITSGANEATMDEIGQITDYIQACAGENADLIWGNGVDESLGEALCVTVIATGFGTNSIPELYIRKQKLDKVSLADTDITPNKVTLNDEQGEFQVKDLPKTNISRTQSNVITQRTIEFEVNEFKPQEARQPEPVSIDPGMGMRKAAQRVDSIKRNYDKIRELGLNSPQRKQSIDDMENQPAYIRRNVEIKNKTYSKEEPVSRFSLDDDGNGVRISENNQFLHDAVD